MSLSNPLRAAAAAGFALAPALASAASLDGSTLGLGWAVPFAGILLCIALCPLFVPHFWHAHFGKVSVFWALCCAVPLCMLLGFSTGIDAVIHVLLADYVPFIIFVGALFVVAGGIHVRGTFVGRPIVNAGVLALGAVLANFMGTTGAAMLLIRPLIEANANRRRKMQTFIFFIFLVANVGGALTPLGDPPLFLGFLKGVSFFWTAEHLLVPWLFTLAILLAVYLAIDGVCYAKDVKDGFRAPDEKKAFGIDGGVNILLLAVIIGAVLLSGFWRPGVEYVFLGVHFALESIVRDVIFLCAAGASLALTTKETRELNHFTWDPILEVAKLFFGIFVCIFVLKLVFTAIAYALVGDGDGTNQQSGTRMVKNGQAAADDFILYNLGFLSAYPGKPKEAIIHKFLPNLAICLGAWLIVQIGMSFILWFFDSAVTSVSGTA